MSTLQISGLFLFIAPWAAIAAVASFQTGSKFKDFMKVFAGVALIMGLMLLGLLLIFGVVK